MIVRSLDANHDWTFGKGRQNYLTNNSAIQQNIETRLLSFLGDCFFATAEGLDWFNLLGSKNQLAAQLAIQACILNTAGVTGIVDVTVIFDHDTRNFRIQYRINTVYSQGGVVAGSVNTASVLATEDGDVITTEDGDPIALG